MRWKSGTVLFNQEFPPSAEYLKPGAFSPLSNPGPALCALAAHVRLVDRLYRTLAPRLTELGMDALYYGVELPLCPVLAEMERTGFLVDRNALAEFGVMLTAGIEQAQSAVHAMAGEQFNLNSTQQLGVILFEKLGLPPVKKTKRIFHYVECWNGCGGSIPSLTPSWKPPAHKRAPPMWMPDLVHRTRRRFHTSFQNTVTATGRLSSRAKPAELPSEPCWAQSCAKFRGCAGLRAWDPTILYRAASARPYRNDRP
jgi:DNA polymerase-1